MSAQSLGARLRAEVREEGLDEVSTSVFFHGRGIWTATVWILRGFLRSNYRVRKVDWSCDCFSILMYTLLISLILLRSCSLIFGICYPIQNLNWALRLSTACLRSSALLRNLELRQRLSGRLPRAVRTTTATTMMALIIPRDSSWVWPKRGGRGGSLQWLS